MRFSKRLLGIPLATALLAALACTTDSPTEPTQSPPAPPVPPAPSVSFEVTVSPGVLTVGGTDGATVSVSAFQGSNPLTGTITLSTTLGGFGSVGGPASITLPLSGGRATATLFPGTVAGVATVQASLPIGAQTVTDTTTVEIRAGATFFLSSVSPASGDPDGGDEITIAGGGFDGPVRVLVGSAPAEVLGVSPSSIRVRTPSAVAATGSALPVGTTRTVAVSVTINLNETGQATDTLANAFTFTHGSTSVLQIFSVTPATGGNDGGTRVSINGTGFVRPLQVLFERSGVGVEATVDSVAENRVVVITPAARGFAQSLSNQSVDVRVRLLDTGQEAVLGGGFRYGSNVLITGMGPGSGPYTGGTAVTIFGQGFDEPVAVSLGGIGQFVRSTTGTEIVFITSGVNVTTCPADGIVEVTGVSVTNLENGDGDDADLGFNYIVPLPLIFGVSPISGNVGSNVTISGQNFATNIQVLFGGAANGSSAQILSKSSTSITARVPTPPPGFTFTQEPCDGNGDGIPGGTRNTPTPISITVRNLDGTGCDVTLSNAFTVNPPNTTCTGDTSTPPPPPVVQCNDGFDNDGDTFIDAADPQCTGPTDNSEST